MIAIAIGALDGAGALSSWTFKYLIMKIGRKNAVILGYLLMMSTNLGLAFLAYIPREDWRWFYGGSVGIRFLMGIADALVLAT